jgi:phytoene dehydrogenase-like protein
VGNITRRELLAAFLGTPAVLALGCQRATLPLPPGELVGNDVDLGHLVRGSLNVEIPEEYWSDHRVVIIGAGIAGLSAARRLTTAGFDDFAIVELEAAPGGTSRSGASNVVSYPWGAHYIPAPRNDFPALVNLLDELDVFEGRNEQGHPIVAEQFRCRFPQERVFFKGSWYEGLYLYAGASSEDRNELRRFEKEIDHWARWRDEKGRRAFTIPMARSTDDERVTQLDRMSMAHWLDEQRFHSSRLRWLVDYACRDDYGSRPEDTSAWAGLFYFAARTNGAEEESRPYITWPEGNGRVVRHLFQDVQDRCHLGWAVADIAVDDKSSERTIEVRAIRPGDQSRGFRAPHVIFAAPQFLARYLLRSYRRQPPAHLDSFQYGAWAVANITLSECPTGEGCPIAWDNVLYESPSLGYVSASYQRGLDHGPTVWTYYYPVCDPDPKVARTRLLEIDRDGWAEIALSDLERAHPNIRSLAQRIDVMRWGHAMIRPSPGLFWGPERPAAAQPIDGLHFAHADLSGLPLFEEAFYHGTRAAEAVLRELGIVTSSIL